MTQTVSAVNIKERVSVQLKVLAQHLFRLFEWLLRDAFIFPHTEMLMNLHCECLSLSLLKEERSVLLHLKEEKYWSLGMVLHRKDGVILPILHSPQTYPTNSAFKMILAGRGMQVSSPLFYVPHLVHGSVSGLLKVLLWELAPSYLT